MKAAQIQQFGGRDQVEIVDIEKPEPGEGQVLVEVHASSINPADSKIREGKMVKSPPVEFPMILGMDLAGIVAGTGPNVSAFKAGDKVYGQTHAWSGGTGAYAEYAVTAAGALGKMPANLDFRDAGAVPLVGVSAIMALMDHIQLKKGQRLFILGGAGGIGSIAIQLAKYIGAHVAATGTGDDIEFERGLGADEIIDYRKQSFEEVLSGYDAAFDTVGGESYTRAIGILKRGGAIVSMAHKPDEKLMEEHGVNGIHQFTKVTTDYLDRLTKLIEDGVIRVHIDQTHTLDTVREAFEIKESRPVLGKIALTIR